MPKQSSLSCNKGNHSVVTVNCLHTTVQLSVHYHQTAYIFQTENWLEMVCLATRCKDHLCKEEKKWLTWSNQYLQTTTATMSVSSPGESMQVEHVPLFGTA